MVKTADKIEEEIRAIFSGDTPWVTIVWDDPVNLQTYVVYVFMELFGYSKARRSAFWQFCSANSVPHIRTGKRKVQFCEQAVLDWVNHRSNTRNVLGRVGQ